MILISFLTFIILIAASRLSSSKTDESTKSAEESEHWKRFRQELDEATKQKLRKEIDFLSKSKRAWTPRDEDIDEYGWNEKTGRFAWDKD